MVGVGDEENPARGGEQHFVGMFFHRPAGDHLVRLQIDDGYLGIAPETDIELLTPIVQAAGVRENGGVIQFGFDSFARRCDGLKSRSRWRQGNVNDGFLLQIDFGCALTIQVCHAKPFRAGIQGQPGGNANVLDVAQANVQSDGTGARL